MAAKLMLPWDPHCLWAYWNVSCWVLRAEMGNHRSIQGMAGAQSLHSKETERGLGHSADPPHSFPLEAHVCFPI